MIQKSKKRTLVVARRVLTESKTALVDAIPAVFSARLRASMDTFKAKIASFWSFGRWAFMVENRGSGERTVWREGCEEGSES